MIFLSILNTTAFVGMAKTRSALQDKSENSSSIAFTIWLLLTLLFPQI